MDSSTRRRRSRIAHFKTPFLISLAGPASLGLACGGETLEEPTAEVDTSGLIYNPPRCATPSTCVTQPPDLASQCPAEVPEPGSSCEGLVHGLSCDISFCFRIVPGRVCGGDGRWHELPMPTCSPPGLKLPPASCSPEMPVPGSDCQEEGEECRYPGCEGPSASWARCTNGQWLVEYSIGPACNPPPVIPVCPELEPVAGAGCAYAAQECGYGSCGESLVPSRSYTCADGAWQMSSGCAAVDAGADASPPAP